MKYRTIRGLCFWCGEDKGCLDNMGPLPNFTCYACGYITDNPDLLYTEKES